MKINTESLLEYDDITLSKIKEVLKHRILIIEMILRTRNIARGKGSLLAYREIQDTYGAR